MSDEKVFDWFSAAVTCLMVFLAAWLFAGGWFIGAARHHSLCVDTGNVHPDCVHEAKP